MPTADQIRRAVELYVRLAYADGVPEAVGPLLPPQEDFDPGQWLANDTVQCDRRKADGGVVSFAIRLGNRFYPHMKLRLVCSPDHATFLFMIDAHDSMLLAHAGPKEAPLVRQLNQRNAEISQAITAAWTEAGLPTERSWLRAKIEKGRTDPKR